MLRYIIRTSALNVKCFAGQGVDAICKEKISPQQRKTGYQEYHSLKARHLYYGAEEGISDLRDHGYANLPILKEFQKTPFLNYHNTLAHFEAFVISRGGRVRGRQQRFCIDRCLKRLFASKF